MKILYISTNYNFKTKSNRWILTSSSFSACWTILVREKNCNKMVFGKTDKFQNHGKIERVGTNFHLFIFVPYVSTRFNTYNISFRKSNRKIRYKRCKRWCLVHAYKRKISFFRRIYNFQNNDLPNVFFAPSFLIRWNTSFKKKNHRNPVVA